MSAKFMIVAAMFGAVCSIAVGLNIMQYGAILAATNLIWSTACHYNDWFTDV